MKVTVVGVEGCGRTVFLGLLYETLVQMTTAKGNEGKDEVRFICDPRTAKCLGDVRLDLISKRWPSNERKQGIADCTMDIGFRKGRFLGLLPSKEFSTVTVEAVEVGKRDARALEGMTGPDSGHFDPGALSEDLLDALRGTIVVLLLDASMVKAGKGDDRSSLQKADALNASLIGVMMRLKARDIRDGSCKCVPCPVIVLTKFDLVGRIDIADKDVQKTAGEFLRANYPEVAKVLEEQRPKGMKGTVEVIVSGMRTEGSEGDLVPVSVTDKGQVCIDYAVGGYGSLIKVIRRTAEGQTGTKVRRTRS
ncbi:MAG: hypothetical protein LUQ09_03595 [Methanomassiliicoccales archaeon]|nr:hypothetical protein [Methanomassiliicoccales archaeon]